MAESPRRYYKLSNMAGGSRRLEAPRGERFLRVSTVGAKTIVDMGDWALEELPEEIDVICGLGLVELHLPGDIRVDYRGAGIFGAFGGNARHTHPIPGTPVVVRGIAVLGGVDVRVPFLNQR